jgi:ATP-binding cassette, subfamily B, bacterial
MARRAAAVSGWLRTTAAGLRPRAESNVVGLLRYAGWRAVAGGVMIQLLSGLLPTAFMISSSELIGHVPAAARGGFHSAGWHGLEGALIVSTTIVAVQQIAVPVWTVLSLRIQLQVDAEIFVRVFNACSMTAGTGLIERSEGLAPAAAVLRGLRSRRLSPGAAAAAWLTLVARYVAFVSSAIIVAVAFNWLAALLAAAGGLALRRAHRIGYSRYLKTFQTLESLRGRWWYLRRLALGAEIAKESRVFGFAGWLAGHTAESKLAAWEPLWQARRRVFYRPFIIASAVGVIVGGFVLSWAGVATAGHELQLTRLVLVAQAVIAVLSIGAFFEESDAEREWGLRTLLALSELERLMRREGARESRLAVIGPVSAGAVASPVSRFSGQDQVPRCELCFEDVHFAYPGTDAPVFAGLDLRLQAGTSLAVVGLNGAGKTTLLKLLCRFYEPDRGRITVDGVDVRSFPAQDWQGRIAGMFQDFARYPLAASENIGFGAPQALGDIERIQAAAWRAGCFTYLSSLPRGLCTPLSRQYRDGVDLSGGQWQKVALARVLFAIDSGRSVLLLDEPTASLDVRSEADFFARFFELTAGLTTIVISHRFSTVRLANRIVVLDGGKITEDGSHDQLVAAGGTYARLFRLQATRLTGVRHDIGEPGEAAT